jgi:hypothetical protein
MFNIFIRAVIFGLGVELGREIYRAVKKKLGNEFEERREPGSSESQEPTQGEEPPPPPKAETTGESRDEDSSNAAESGADPAERR